jgi:hypothetical protein
LTERETDTLTHALSDSGNESPFAFDTRKTLGFKRVGKSVAMIFSFYFRELKRILKIEIRELLRGLNWEGEFKLESESVIEMFELLELFGSTNSQQNRNSNS